MSLITRAIGDNKNLQCKQTQENEMACRIKDGHGQDAEIRGSFLISEDQRGTFNMYNFDGNPTELKKYKDHAVELAKVELDQSKRTPRNDGGEF